MSMPTQQRLIVLLGCCLALASSATFAQHAYDVNIVKEIFGFDSKTPKSIPFRDLHQGCPTRDCIPSIDEPKFVAAADAAHVADQDVVIAIAWQGEYRAYPSRILDQHEIVNDTIAGMPIAITYCPLCGSAVGVQRNVAGTVTEFGVSGLLYNSDLVFYDRETETLWDQIEATGIVGPLTGEKLQLVPLTMTRWSRWRDAHPDTLVLSADTGFGKDYSKDHYAAYRNTDKLMFPVSKESKRIKPKTVVFGFDIERQSVAFTEDLLVENGSYEYQLNGEDVRVTLADDGSVALRFVATGDTFEPIRLFWFAWYTFHPRTKLIH